METRTDKEIIELIREGIEPSTGLIVSISLSVAMLGTALVSCGVSRIERKVEAIQTSVAIQGDRLATLTAPTATSTRLP